MMYRIIYTPGAEKGLRSIRAYISQDNPRLALYFVRNLRDKMKSLKTHPHRCPLAPENGRQSIEIRHLLYRDYRILFTIAERAVYILEVRHAARLPLA